ncbi:hypothetical protein [Streptomyces griseocarneus]|uniref:hypothetical protein n=1 Tax=Streptomyces griseocarneus TaxID=51201 RepID=UPI00167D0779|nr:hypothetical protein [Streptomyces griseocarneus]MBZ6477398.1 hypothetical protein [Streptomyces griseocarneus]GHG75779.1 hypothetical protein GCM10018779_53480 [Streptomyces griseocarneus]
MQRRAYAPVAALAAAVLSAALAGCGGGGGAGGKGIDAKAGQAGSAVPAGPPGKYHSLPEPCGYVSAETVRRMLPGAGDGDEQEAERLLRGTAAITYDTDRRVGCRWKLETPNGTRHLTVDFERVVSYQPGVSDEARAEQLYERQATAARIPSAAPSAKSSGSPSPGASASASASSKSDPGPGPQLAEASAAPSSANASASADPRLAPRVLDDLGDDAFVNDVLATTSSGVHRDVTVVFRSSNVLVTIAYDQWTTDKQHVPTSQDLQGKAQGLARELDAGHFGN